MARARPPAWSVVTGPWEGGDYVDLALGDDGGLHAVWLEGDALRYARSGEDGATWGAASTITPGAEAGDNGQIRPEIVLDGQGRPTVAYTSAGRTWLAVLTGAGWAPSRVDRATIGAGALSALAVHEGAPVVAWLDTRAAPEEHRSSVWVGPPEVEVYASGADGVCMCCRPALLSRPEGLTLAVRDADGPRREIRLLVRTAEGWADRGEATHGGWSPGGCPADGPALTWRSLLVSDARDGRRRIWQVDADGERALPLLHDDAEAVFPRATPDGQAVLWVEASAGRAELVLLEGERPMPVARTTGRLEPGDPLVVGRELWMPYQGARAVVLRQTGM